MTDDVVVVVVLVSGSRPSLSSTPFKCICIDLFLDTTISIKDRVRPSVRMSRGIFDQRIMMPVLMMTITMMLMAISTIGKNDFDV